MKKLLLLVGLVVFLTPLLGKAKDSIFRLTKMDEEEYKDNCKWWIAANNKNNDTKTKNIIIMVEMNI